LNATVRHGLERGAMHDFVLFMLVGFAAQLVDGALGMAYGVVSSTVLLAFGVPPATASASVHAAEVFTTAASAGSHVAHRNVNWRLFGLLTAGGVLGGVLGAYVLTSIDGDAVKPFVVTYLALMGAMILWRAWRGVVAKEISSKWPLPLGVVGGFMDAVGGGGWGPTVTSTLVGSGASARTAIGTVNTAEFFVTVAISTTFIVALATGHWTEAEGILDHAWAVGGLIAGGLIAAPMAGWITKVIPVRLLTWIVGAVVVLLASYQAARLFKLI
jgi:uncharacterized membrane protein YfcA